MLRFSISHSSHYRQLPYFLAFWTGLLPPSKRWLLLSPIYPVEVIMPLPTRCWICWLPLVSDTRPPLWVCASYPCPHPALGDWQLCISVDYHTANVLSTQTVCTIKPSLCPQHLFPATNPPPQPYIMSVFIHSAGSVSVQLPTHFKSTYCPVTPVLGLRSLSASGTVHH